MVSYVIFTLGSADRKFWGGGSDGVLELQQHFGTYYVKSISG